MSRAGFSRLLFIVFAAVGTVLAQSGSVNMVVTVLPAHGDTAPVVSASDVLVHQGHARDAVNAWTPLQGDHAGLELYLAIDDDTADLGNRLNDLRQFVASLPSSTAIAIGYLQSGTAVTVQPMTLDHARAAQTLRLPIAQPGISPSPYDSVQQILKHWPAAAEPTAYQRRALIMISDGVEHYDGNNPENQILKAAIAQVQRAGLLVYSIYARGAEPGHSEPNQIEIDLGQGNLELLSAASGGESYSEAGHTPVNMVPFLQQIENHIDHQYLLAFTPTPSKPGLQPVQIKLETGNTKILAAPLFRVP